MVAGSAALALIVGGGAWLLDPWFGVPAGNVLAVVALTGVAEAALAMAPPGWLRRAARLGLVLAVLWFPASALLAGNLALVFDGAAGLYWMGLTGAVAAYLLLVAAAVAIARWVARPRR